MTPRILIIAGSDSGGGAGIQADIKTVTMLGGHAMTAITAITAQNTVGVQAIMPVPAEMVIAQIKSCVDDIGIDAIKIGMLGSAQTADAVADWLEAFTNTHPGEGRGPGEAAPKESAAGRSSPLPGPRLCGGETPVVFDPVMIATSGDPLADDGTIAAFDRLMRLASVTTPNLPELAALGGEASVLTRTPALLIKGGHADGPILVDRLVTSAGEVARWQSERIDTPHTHGTGCTLASAIATYLAAGRPLERAIANAREFVRAAILAAPGLGHGHGPMGHQGVTGVSCLV